MLLIRFTMHILIVATVLSSSGDMDPMYRNCILGCDCVQEDSGEGYSVFAASMLIGYIFPALNCYESCSYDCMQSITKMRISKGHSILKYYGHWPVTRHFDMEEPASAIFSMLNCLPHLSYLLGRVCKEAENTQYYMTKWLNVLTFVSLNAWVTSTLYHSKKTTVSSRVDYASALLLLSYSLWVALRRIWAKYANPSAVSVAFTVYMSIVTYRIRDILMGNFTFQNHMIICIGISIMHVSVWLLWILYVYLLDRTSFQKERRFKFTAVHSTCLVCQLLFVVAAMLEIFDFLHFMDSLMPTRCGTWLLFL